MTTTTSDVESPEQRLATLRTSPRATLTRQQLAWVLGVEPDSVDAGRRRGGIPEPDGQFGRTPFWNVSTISKLLVTRAQPRKRTRKVNS